MLGHAVRGQNATVGGPGIRALLVDDNTNVTELYAIWLEQACAVTVTHTGDDALDALDETFDVVLLDRQLPEWSGSELLAELRLRGHDQPVVMITGTEPDVDIVDLSIDEYLVKPISEDELIDAVEFAVQLSSYDDALHEFYSLVSKRVALESSNVTPDLRETDAYRDVEERISSLEAQLERRKRTFDEEQYPQLFRRVLE